MKDSSEWATQSVVDKAADRLLLERGDLDLMNANQVAKLVGMDRANQSLNDKYDDWRRRQVEAGRLHMKYAPAGLKEAMEGKLREAFTGIVDSALCLSGKNIFEKQAVNEKTHAVYQERFGAFESDIRTLEEKVDHLAAQNSTLQSKLAEANSVIAKQRSRADLAEARHEEARGLNEKLLGSISALRNDQGTEKDKVTAPRSPVQPNNIGNGSPPAQG